MSHIDTLKQQIEEARQILLDTNSDASPEDLNAAIDAAILTMDMMLGEQSNHE